MEEAAVQGNELFLSPASHAYVDMKYKKSIPLEHLGIPWAGYTSVKDAYSWSPGSYIEGVNESAVLGVEAPLWTETVDVMNEIEFMAFPRVAAIAELGWSPAAKTEWESFKQRLAAQGPRWDTLGINFYRSPQVPWPPEVEEDPYIDIDSAGAE